MTSANKARKSRKTIISIYASARGEFVPMIHTLDFKYLKVTWLFYHAY
jgi:hypothetical protein